MAIDLNAIRKVSKPKTAMQIVIDTEEHEKLLVICTEEKLKMAQLIRSLIRDFLETYRKKEK